MKTIVETLLNQAINTLKHETIIPTDIHIDLKVDLTKDSSHGDYACNIAMVLAKNLKKSPREIAELIKAKIPEHAMLKEVTIAGPGFINFFLNESQRTEIISEILKKGNHFGENNEGQGQKLLLEYVSANPTGPLHVGHGRGAAFGASLANLLKTSGFDVSTEYYVNDAGRQMDILAVSVWLRYLALAGETIVFPANAYRGDYVIPIAEEMVKRHGRDYAHPWDVISVNLPKDEMEGGDKEEYIDALIKRAKELLGQAGFLAFHEHALETVLNDIKDDLREFGVNYDHWFPEKTLEADGSITNAINSLKAAGYTYEKEGALWFNATNFGDEKDRVLVRANGKTTYFAADVAYHWNKYHRGYQKVIDIFGADHHGYVSRIKASVKALGHDDKSLNILLVQFAILFRGGERVQMSTRSGSFVTLRELRQEVGNDAARFFYVMRKAEQHMDFDLDLAKSHSNENPVYYIQYAHARICSVFKQLKERHLNWDEKQGLNNLHLLQESQELAVINLLLRYTEVIIAAARNLEPHQIAYYLRDLANSLHSYYNAVQLLCEEESIRYARLCLLKAVQHILYNGLHLLGVSAPESM